MLPRISVVVCTYNRADLLAGVLQTLCEQTIDGSEYEIIVVDNNSSDDTRFVVEEFCRRYRNIRYCFEPNQGLSHARNRGWREAHGEYVAYIDDDCKAPEEWLMVAREVIDQVSPGVFGGPYYPFYAIPKARWFKDSYGSHEEGNEARVLGQNRYLSGGNIFFRRTLLESLGGFDPRFGMSGQKIAHGEETALQRLVRTVMPDQPIYYDPRLYVYHLVPARKMSIGYIVRRCFASGRDAWWVFRVGTTPREREGHLLGQIALVFLKSSLALLLIVLDFSFGMFFRDRSRYPYLQNYLYEHTFRYVGRLGGYSGQLRHILHGPKPRIEARK